ncbi:bifunctional helix-turn-helix transcriptional regulator/GNAT family N-acetyltransferase [Aquibium microcysteis]|uniref:bifunctional helix-turn-helix transcriptional regulator/GNAT family N-acetyltransferase n=1 Tax=Aquibium microcysteis TaxID=675281 RepID=UPI00165D1C34|nr:helix-turn-helix domain-containing GNAT family N-acetyltransferase [Aquibium microcysteis]
MVVTEDAEGIAEIRSFNRFYTRLLGALNEGLLRSPYSLPESRLLYELGSRGRTTAADLAADLGMDPGYLSRLLRKLRDGALVESVSSPDDGRAQILSLTPAGVAAFQTLDRASHEEVAALVAPLAGRETDALVGAMRTIRRLLDPVAVAEPVIVRPFRIGEIGHIISRHGVLYHEEHGWDGSFEGFVAEIAGAFVMKHDPMREGCWVAARGGEVLGSVFVVDAGEGTAKLRMLYVEPAARGLGVGRRLVGQAIGFAHGAGYRRMTLWTNDILHSARRIYEGAGFRLVAEERHRSFGRDLVGQNWDLDLDFSRDTATAAS